MRKPIIRFAIPFDEDALISIIKATKIGDHHLVNDRVEDLLLENVLVAQIDEKVVGFISWVNGRRYAYIDSLAVLPEYQKEGVGAWLHNELGKILSSLNIHYVYACTQPNAGGLVRAMLGRLGYVPMGVTFNMGKRLEAGGS